MGAIAAIAGQRTVDGRKNWNATVDTRAAKRQVYATAFSARPNDRLTVRCVKWDGNPRDIHFPPLAVRDSVSHSAAYVCTPLGGRFLQFGAIFDENVPSCPTNPHSGSVFDEGGLRTARLS